MDEQESVNVSISSVLEFFTFEEVLALADEYRVQVVKGTVVTCVDVIKLGDVHREITV